MTANTANTTIQGTNHGMQIGQNLGNIEAHFQSAEDHCIRDLLTTDPQDDRKRIIQEKGGLLQDSFRWVLECEEFQQWQTNADSHLLWIKGDPGKGKTMLICGILDRLPDREGVNVAFFFCQAADPRLNTATAVLRGLVFMLVNRQPSLRPHLQRRYEQAGKQLFEGTNAWTALSGIFSAMLSDPSLHETFIAIDALDECTVDLPLLLGLIVDQQCSPRREVKWLLSSRNWKIIEEFLDPVVENSKLSLETHERAIASAVAVYIRHEVGKLSKQKRYSENLHNEVFYHLTSEQPSTFLWVSLVCRALAKSSVLNTRKLLLTFPSGLTPLYQRMLKDVLGCEDATLCKSILGVALTVFRPINVDELEGVLELPEFLIQNPQYLLDAISLCGSFLILHEQTITFVHQSAKEFLIETSKDIILADGIPNQHYAIFTHSLKTMSLVLRRDIYHVHDPDTHINSITRPDSDPLASIRYVCLYWVSHLELGIQDHPREFGSLVEVFLHKYYLQWIEAVSLLRRISEGIRAMVKLEMVVQAPCDLGHLREQIYDAVRFIQTHRAAIERFPLQIYFSALLFSPRKSITKRFYQNEMPSWVLDEPVLEDNWSLCTHRLEGHSDTVIRVAWSPKGDRLASGSNDGTVRIWDADTGGSIMVLNGHVGNVTSLEWSPIHEQRLLSCGLERNKTGPWRRWLRLWDLTSGKCIHRIDGDMCIWSKDGFKVAIVVEEKLIRLWDVAAGTILTLGGHDAKIKALASSYFDQLASQAFFGHVIKIWDLRTGTLTATLEHLWVDEFVWSPDGTQLASVSNRGPSTVKLWNPKTSQCIKEFGAEVLSGPPVRGPIAWSQHTNRLVVASSDMMRIFDPIDGQCVLSMPTETTGRYYGPWCSADGTRVAALITSGKEIRIWDLATGEVVSIFGHTGAANALSWFPDGRHIALATDNKVIEFWRTSGFERKAADLDASWPGIDYLAWSHDGMWLLTQQSGNVKVWNSLTKHRTTVAPEKRVYGVSWSPTRPHLGAILNEDRVIIWDPATAEILEEPESLPGLARLISWSRDGNRLAILFRDNSSIAVWEPGSPLTLLDGHNNLPGSVAWSSQCHRLVSFSNEEGSSMIRIWSKTGGSLRCTATIEGPFGDWESISWSRAENTILLWSSDCYAAIMWSSVFGNGTIAGNFELHNMPIIKSELRMYLDPETFMHYLENSSSPDLARINPDHLPPLYKRHAYSISEDKSWINYQNKGLLFLPADYRPNDTPLCIKETASSINLAFGCRSGRVLFFRLSKGNPML
ncbi:uncharacterized protein BO97DRAFT_275191 [Aspergillus homomorphus CBS 101889]|uniref:Mitochondrial division protein 1 n=1 Tax=Aspergillus homomorphus (strain CBS 101889) TaxID=1450537 RepID=A0A395I4L3_ASPHC|nr:hypothetical protein BO97DRAFT_275191 [Aspergillus homomorphus CBS 101889]RAL14679.1 hypothetical protein BO97DRAFT_275191 [Aspergillus homomorphus CBS 101889]